jgi:two-component system, LytTR family, sensor kinase
MLNFKKPYWLFQFLGWTAFLLIQLFFFWSYSRYAPRIDWNLSFTKMGISTSIGLVITHLMRLVIIRLKLLDKKLKSQIVSFFILSSVFSLICGFFEIELLQLTSLISPQEKMVFAKKGFLLISFENTVNWALYIFIWNSIYLLYHFISNYQKQQIDTLQLKSTIKELELNTLKSHINPHFIFNALNSIRALVDEDPQRARKAITELSNILRSSITTDKTEVVLLDEELNIVSDYLALEHMRFEDRLQVQFDIDDPTRTIPVPPMMLQALTENAIKHGISQEVYGGIIKISSHLKNNSLELTVENTGKLNNNNSQGFGIKSTIERLNILYGGKGSFEIRQATPETVIAKVTIPLGTL